MVSELMFSVLKLSLLFSVKEPLPLAPMPMSSR
jgi:hypothetical protein